MLFVDVFVFVVCGQSLCGLGTGMQQSLQYAYACGMFVAFDSGDCGTTTGNFHEI